jgi:archaellum component FlaC
LQASTSDLDEFSEVKEEIALLKEQVERLAETIKNLGDVVDYLLQTTSSSETI